MSRALLGTFIGLLLLLPLAWVASTYLLRTRGLEASGTQAFRPVLSLEESRKSLRSRVTS